MFGASRWILPKKQCKTANFSPGFWLAAKIEILPDSCPGVVPNQNRPIVGATICHDLPRQPVASKASPLSTGRDVLSI